MGVKCPKKKNRWVYLGNVLESITPAINATNITFALLQNRSLLLAQQEAHIMVLVATIKTMFELKIIDQDDADAEKDDHSCDEAEKTVVLKQIVAYAETLVIDLQAMRAERDENNLPRELVSPPVLPDELIGLRPAYVICDVLDPHRERILRYWSAEDIDQIEEDHRQLVAAYKNGPILRCAIDGHYVKTTFDDDWDVTPGKYLRLRTFCGGLATVFPITTSVESYFIF
ncbi:unnamed protein product [Hyaloperonospora brassicae]|uniref:Uncharacterized protein n=1 Tax=Hyaloperonospora brassicae TaxID=162125 RepID=A0AAV0V2U5_HYABA|nr:unnamed protein product [Hyaloperonospora brassicae]